MPAYRNVHVASRRSRRLSQQEPMNYAEDKWEGYEALALDRGSVTPETVSSPTSSLFTSSSKSPSKIEGTEQPRVSHSRRRPEGYIPRPPNAFMIFRSEFWAREKQKEHPIERNHRNISRIVSHCWNSLEKEEKDRYQTLAEERKQLHLLQHPGYRYAPANIPKKTGKRREKKESKKGDKEEEEKCRKLAALIMDNLPSSGIQEVPKDTKIKPMNRRLATHQQSSHSHRRISNAAFPRVPSNTAELVPSVQSEFLQEEDVDAFLVEGFVPTDQIPDLDLSAIKGEEVLKLTSEASIRPPSYDVIGSQFGFRPATSQLDPDPCFWYSPQSLVEEDLASPLLPDDSFLSTRELKNPFEHMVATNWNPMLPVDQDWENVGRHIASTMLDGIDPCALLIHDTDMNQYLHFDY